MEVAGVVFRQSPCFTSTTADASNSFPVPNSLRPNLKSLAAFVFSDKSHLQYYSGPRMEKEEVLLKKKEMKKKVKLLKGLSKNLSTFSVMGFCLHPDSGLDEQVKGQMISEAAEVLIGQMQKLKEDKLESKRMKKAKKKASRMMMMTKDSSSSSSSESSCSSESDCDNVVNMKSHQEAASSVQTAIGKVEEDCDNVVNMKKIREDCGKKIEVCMGGKCKKSGGAMLLENFQKAVGVGGEAEVVGCKCMGKCREGPNVKVRSSEEAMATSLCIGVGLEDVDKIVTNFFGGSQRSCSHMLSSV